VTLLNTETTTTRPLRKDRIIKHSPTANNVTQVTFYNLHLSIYVHTLSHDQSAGEFIKASE